MPVEILICLTEPSGALLPQIIQLFNSAFEPHKTPPAFSLAVFDAIVTLVKVRSELPWQYIPPPLGALFDAIKPFLIVTSELDSLEIAPPLQQPSLK